VAGGGVLEGIQTSLSYLIGRRVYASRGAGLVEKKVQRDRKILVKGRTNILFEEELDSKLLNSGKNRLPNRFSST